MRSPAFILLAVLLCLTQASAKAEEARHEARLLRSVSGRGIDERGFANIATPLKKGMTFDVVKQELGKVTLKVDGRKVVVASGDVLVSEKSPATQAAFVAGAPPGFVPGRVVVLSARYSLAGNQPRNVKNSVEKLIPDGTLMKPVEILVSDQLSKAAQNQGDGGQSVAVIVTPEVVAVTSQTIYNPKNVLTVEYMFNGQRVLKQAVEGTKMVIP